MCSRSETIEKRTKVVDDCWVWQLSLDRDGYGRKGVDGKTIMAHRWAYQMMVGPIPDGKQIDHLCRNRACVNPAHLDVVDCRENLMRGRTNAAKNIAKTHCSKGHPLSGANLYSDARGWRGCNTCRSEAAQRYRAKRRA